MPTLGIPREDLNDNQFINAYLGDVDKEEYFEEDVVLLLFNPKDLEKFTEFLDKQYESNTLLIEDYDSKEGYVVLVYQMSTKIQKNDLSLVKKGRYSETSNKFKELFPKKIELLNRPGKPEKTSLQWMIFRKDPQLISYVENIIGSNHISEYNLEVWPTFDEKKEILDINQI